MKKDKKVILAVASGIESLLYDSSYTIGKVNQIVSRINQKLKESNSRYLLCTSDEHKLIAITENK